MTGFSNSLQTMGIQGAWRRIISGGPTYLALVFVFGLTTAVGIAAGIHALFIVGSRHAYGVYREIPLAIQISTYAFFIGASTGIYLLSSIGHVFGIREFMPIAKRTVFLSIITILSGYLVIGLEIENPLRMLIYNITSPNFSSNIWWMATLYGFFLVFMVIGFVFLLLGRHRIASMAGLMGVISVVAADSNMGGVFAMMHGREYWYGPFLPVYFIASAMMTGCAFIIFFTLCAYRIKKEPMEPETAGALEIIGKLAILMVAIIMFFTFWKILTGMVGGLQKVEAMKALLAGAYAFNFWGIEIIGGMLIPFILLLISKGKQLTFMLIASALMIFSIFFMRLDLVVVGQIVPLYLDLGVKEYPRLHPYFPSLHEILVVLGGVGLCGFAFLLGEKIFDGFRETDSCLLPMKPFNEKQQVREHE
jgi:Ni/Fe-hydrogenase subunit HybB-like protein